MRAAFRCSGITGRRTSAPLPRLSSQRQSDSACVGCRTTDPDTVALRPTLVETCSAADLVSSVAAALGIDRFAVMGHSGGGSHALACGALLEGRVRGVVSMAALAPFDAGGLDWFAGMAASGEDSLRAATAGRAEKQRYEASGAEYDPEFTPADEAALAGGWSWLLDVVRPALAQGPGGLIDDDLAYVAPWGAEVEQITAPTLILHGGRDRVVPSAHAEWLADRCPAAELRLSPDEGHISILGASESAVEWLRQRVD